MPRQRKYLRLFIFSGVFVGFCTYVALDAVLRIGEIVRLPPRVVGLILMATGTNLSDALGSVAVARSGEGHVVVANVLGAPVFDILFGLGVPWMFRILAGYKVEYLEYKEPLSRDVFLLAAVVAVFMAALLVKGFMMTRRVGMLLILLHVAFILYVLITGPDTIPKEA